MASSSGVPRAGVIIMCTGSRLIASRLPFQAQLHLAYAMTLNRAFDLRSKAAYAITPNRAEGLTTLDEVLLTERVEAQDSESARGAERNVLRVV